MKKIILALVLILGISAPVVFGADKAVVYDTTNKKIKVSDPLPVANVDTGTTANKILKLDANAKIPAVDGSLLTGIPPVGATYITQTADATLTGEQALSTLDTGIMKVTTTTGAITSLPIPLATASGGTGATANANAASGVVVLDASAKLPHAALKAYCSDWTLVGLNAKYDFPHNLGTTKILLTVLLAQNSDGSGWCTQLAIHTDAGYNTATALCLLSITSLSIRTATASLCATRDSAGTRIEPTAGYMRVSVLALE